MKDCNDNSPSLKKNYLYRVLYEILIIITPFITTPYVSRVLGADGVGDYSFAHSVITYFMLFGALGTASYGSREISRTRDDKKASSKLFWEIELMTVFTTGICLAIWAGMILSGGKYGLFFLSLTPFLIGTMFDVSWFFTGLERVRDIVVRNLIVRVTGIVLLFCLVKTREDILTYCVINSATSLLGNLSMWIYLPGMLEKVDPRQFRFKRHFRETLVYFIPTVATSVYTVLDKTLIGLITASSYQNGYYEQATKIINIVKSVVFTAVNSVMTARMSYLFAKERYEEIREKISKSMDFILFLGIGAVFGLAGIAHRFVPAFFGEGYGPVEGLIYIMSPLVIIIGISNCLGSHYYTPSGKRAQSARFIITGAILNLVLNICFIPVLSSTGAVIASIIAEVTITALYLKNCEGFLTAGMIARMLWKRLIAGIIMVLIVYMVGKLEWSDIMVLPIQIVCGGCAYCLLLTIMKDQMIYYLLGIIKKKIKRDV